MDESSDEEIEEGSESSDEEITEEIVEQADENIGSRLNEWIFPVSVWGNCDKKWKINTENQLGKIDFSKKEWDTSCHVVNHVFAKLIEESIDIAEDDFEGLDIKKYIYQGSCRDGLKVIEPDEFDTIILFELHGIPLKVKHLTQTNQIVPEVVKVTVKNSINKEEIYKSCPILIDNNIINKDDDEYCIDTRSLYGVFETIFSTAIKEIPLDTKIGKGIFLDEITLSRNEPSINLSIKYTNNKKDKQIIDVDVVPAVIVKHDEIKLAGHYKNKLAKCPVYAVLKWIPDDEASVWRMCYSGFEKHMIDEARNVVKGQIILTALRLLKTFFKNEKESSEFQPISRVVKSYHLKNIMFYVLWWLLQKHPEIEIHSVQQVLIYYVVYLLESIRHRKLPHFMHSSSMSHLLIKKSIRYNLFRKSEKVMMDALKKFRKQFRKLIDYKKYDNDIQISSARKEYVREITHGDFILRLSVRLAIQKNTFESLKSKKLLREPMLNLRYA